MSWVQIWQSQIRVIRVVEIQLKWKYAIKEQESGNNTKLIDSKKTMVAELIHYIQSSVRCICSYYYVIYHIFSLNFLIYVLVISPITPLYWDRPLNKCLTLLILHSLLCFIHCCRGLTCHCDLYCSTLRRGEVFTDVHSRTHPRIHTHWQRHLQVIIIIVGIVPGMVIIKESFELPAVLGRWFG